MLNDKLKDELPASNYYEEMDYVQLRKEVYNLNVTLYASMTDCLVCHHRAILTAIVLSERGSFITHDTFCSEACAVDWYEKLHNSPFMPEQEFNYHVNSL